jgi:hypothetical protein
MATEPLSSTGKRGILMPAPTLWPFAMAVGNALVFFGLLTYPAVSVLGAILAIYGAVGWFREVLPHEHEELVPLRAELPAMLVAPQRVQRMEVVKEVHRAWLPLKVYPMSAGVKGGLAGGVVMAILASIYGIFFYGSIWYPINLLAGSLYSPQATPSIEAMKQFRMDWFLFALAMHITMCLLVGLLYGAMLPMLPHRPVVLGGIVGPIIWTGLLYHVIGYVNPLLDARINWWLFAVSQVGFGIVAGLVVARQNKQWTKENLPLAVRAGIEAPGLMEERGDEGKKR